MKMNDVLVSYDDGSELTRKDLVQSAAGGLLLAMTLCGIYEGIQTIRDRRRNKKFVETLNNPQPEE